ncbi:MAG: hypothetical protein IT577_06260 [Verrucomicrobiae bacterium]|nr:hypothetical protein [Verrucomicrobiae bacterium]
MKDFPVGYVALSKASWVTPEIEGIRQCALEGLRRLPFEILDGGALTTTTTEASALSAELNRRGAKAVIVHVCTFPVGATIPVIARELRVPILLFANPERPAAGGIWAQNSFCGANMAVHTLRKMGRKYAFVFGPAGEADALLRRQLNVVKCMADLASTKIGLVGGRAPGFYSSNCDEMRLRSAIGAEIEIIDLLEIVDTAGRLDDDEARQGATEIRLSSASVCETVGGDIDPAGRLYQALKKTASKHGLTSYAIRCWPEWSDIFGIAPCAAMGLLNNNRLAASCEGDVLGAVLMRAQSALCGGLPFFADLISFDSRKNTGVFWHCGAAPSKLCSKFEETRMRRHFRVDGGDKKGLVNEFALKPGRITLAQLDENGDNYRMLIATGTAIDTEPFVRGNPLEVRFDCPVDTLVSTIMDNGFKHHYSLIHADIAEDLIDLCKWLDIAPVAVGCAHE